MTFQLLQLAMVHVLESQQRQKSAGREQPFRLFIAEFPLSSWKAPTRSKLQW